MEDIDFGSLLSVEDYIRISLSVGWTLPEKRQATAGIENAVHIVTAIDKRSKRVVGMARAVGDKGTIAIITDVAVEPAYRGSGIGTAILKRLIETIKFDIEPGQKVMISLLADAGKESFYHQIGFDISHENGYGKNMYMWYIG